MKEECCEGEMPPGLGSRVAVSIAVFFGWLVFLVVWLVFFAKGFSVIENIGIALVAFLVGIAVLAMAWASWGIKYGKKMERWKHAGHMKEAPQAARPRARRTRKRVK